MKTFFFAGSFQTDTSFFTQEEVFLTFVLWRTSHFSITHVETIQDITCTIRYMVSHLWLFFFFLTFSSYLGNMMPEVKNTCGILPVSLKITLAKCIIHVEWNTLVLKDKITRRLEQRIQVSKEINLQKLIWVRNIMEYASLILSLKMMCNDRNTDFTSKQNSWVLFEWRVLILLTGWPQKT